MRSRQDCKASQTLFTANQIVELLSFLMTFTPAWPWSISTTRVAPLSYDAWCPKTFLYSFFHPRYPCSNSISSPMCPPFPDLGLWTPPSSGAKERLLFWTAEFRRTAVHSDQLDTFTTPLWLARGYKGSSQIASQRPTPKKSTSINWSPGKLFKNPYSFSMRRNLRGHQCQDMTPQACVTSAPLFPASSKLGWGAPAAQNRVNSGEQSVAEHGHLYWRMRVCRFHKPQGHQGKESLEWPGKAIFISFRCWFLDLGV